LTHVQSKTMVHQLLNTNILNQNDSQAGI